MSKHKIKNKKSSKKRQRAKMKRVEETSQVCVKSPGELSHKDETEIRTKRISLSYKVLSFTFLASAAIFYSYCTISNISDGGRMIMAGLATSFFIFSCSVFKYIVFELKNIKTVPSTNKNIVQADNAYEYCWGSLCPVLIFGTIVVIILELFFDQFISNNTNLVFGVACVIGSITEIADWFIKSRKASFVIKAMNVSALIGLINIVLSFVCKAPQQSV